MSTKVYNCILTPEELDVKIDEFIAYCNEHNEPPTDYVIRYVIGISDNTIQQYRHYADLEIPDEADEDEKAVIVKKRALGERIKKIDLYRTHFWQKQGLDNPKAIGLANFALKQPQNGGWTDREQKRDDVTITVKLGKIDASEAFG